MLGFILFIILAITILLLFNFLLFIQGFFLIRFFPRLGSRFWAASGLFMKKLPAACPADRCRSCSIYNCPNFRKEVNTK